MPTKAQVISDLDFLSERVSNRVWTVSLSVLAFGWTVINTAEPTLLSLWIVAAVALAFLALVADLLQYLSGIALSHGLLRDMEGRALDSLGYDQRSIWFRIRQAMFYSKVSLAIVATACLVGTLAWESSGALTFF